MSLIPVIHFDHLNGPAIDALLKALESLKLVSCESRGTWKVVHVNDRFPRMANVAASVKMDAEKTYNWGLAPKALFARSVEDSPVPNNIADTVVQTLIRGQNNPQLVEVLLDLVIDNGSFAMEVERPLFTYYQDPPAYDVPHIAFVFTAMTMAIDEYLHTTLRVSAFEDGVLVGIADLTKRRDLLDDEL